MTPLFAFGEHLDGYAVPVLNERAVRAGAGILFLLAMVAFMNAWLLGNFGPTRMFVVGFLIDFTIRIFVNPRYAPAWCSASGSCASSSRNGPARRKNALPGRSVSVWLH